PDKDEDETENDVQRARINLTGPEVAEFRKQHRADHDHPRHQTGGEKSEQNDEQPADQCHAIAPSLLGALATTQSISQRAERWIASRSLSSGGALRRPVGSQ